MPLSISSIYQSRIIRTVAIFSSGNMLAMLIGVAGSLVQARYIGPKDMGEFRTFGIVAGYLTFLHLGVFDGLQREIPLQLGRGYREKAERAASACLAWIMFISAASALIFLLLAIRAACLGQWMNFGGWIAHLPFIIATFYGGYLGTTYRSGQEFIALSKTNVIQAVAGALVLPFLPMIGYYGACLRTAVTAITNLFFLHRWRPMKVQPHLDWVGFREVVHIGLPLSGVGYIYTSLWSSLEGTLVLMWFGTEVLGLYSVALFVRGVVAILAQNINQVINVRIYAQYGSSGRVRDCLNLIYKPMAFAFLMSLPLVLVGWLSMPWAVSMLIPKYVGAIPIMRVVLVVMPITFLSLLVTIIWATGRWILCFKGVTAGFVTFVGLSYVSCRLNMDVLSIPIASMLGQMVNVIVSYILILRLVRQEKKNESLDILPD